jgi:hypothetical protein
MQCPAPATGSAAAPSRAGQSTQRFIRSKGPGVRCNEPAASKQADGHRGHRARIERGDATRLIVELAAHRLVEAEHGQPHEGGLRRGALLQALPMAGVSRVDRHDGGGLVGENHRVGVLTQAALRVAHQDIRRRHARRVQQLALLGGSGAGAATARRGGRAAIARAAEGERRHVAGQGLRHRGAHRRRVAQPVPEDDHRAAVAGDAVLLQRRGARDRGARAGGGKTDDGSPNLGRAENGASERRARNNEHAAHCWLRHGCPPAARARPHQPAGSFFTMTMRRPSVLT